MSDDSEIRPERVREVLAHALASLPPDDQAARIAWCQENNAHGVRMFVDEDDDIIEFRWGGRRLAVMRRDVLTNDEPVHFEMAPDEPVPDTLPEDW